MRYNKDTNDPPNVNESSNSVVVAWEQFNIARH